MADVSQEARRADALHPGREPPLFVGGAVLGGRGLGHSGQSLPRPPDDHSGRSHEVGRHRVCRISDAGLRGQHPDHTGTVGELLPQQTVLHNRLVQGTDQRFDVALQPGDLFSVRGPQFLSRRTCWRSRFSLSGVCPRTRTLS